MKTIPLIALAALLAGNAWADDKNHDAMLSWPAPAAA